MINLTPNEEKKRIAHNFYFRLAILSFFMLGVALCFAAMSIVPAFILVNAKDNFANEKLMIQESEPAPVIDQKTSEAIQNLDAKLSLIESLKDKKFVISGDVINEIIKSMVPSIKITKISYDNDLVTGKKIGIYGTSRSREQLLLFRRALENNAIFSNVNLPISNFVKGSDIEFYLTLISKTGQ